jgi:hypothetical protein
MIRDYKLYHGAVLADIIDRFDGTVSFRELVDPGRLLNYVVNDVIGLQIKYSTARLRPWGFSFPEEHVQQLRKLQENYVSAFAVLVCHTDGFAAIDVADLLASLTSAKCEHAWIRVDRKKREMYRVFGPNGEFPMRFHTTSKPIIETLVQNAKFRNGASNTESASSTPETHEFK